MSKPALLSTPMRHFLAVADAGSVSGAAQRLHVAASAVSRQLARLEDALGQPLFDRSPRGMRPTAAGVRLAGHLRVAAADADRVLRALRHAPAQDAPQLRLACTEGFATGFVPALMTRLRRQRPALRLHLTVAEGGAVSEQVRHGRCELGLKYSVGPEPGLVALHSEPAPVHALMRPEHPLARRRSLTLPDIVRHPLALALPGSTVRQLFDLGCALKGLRYTARIETDSSAALLPMLCDTDIALAGRLTAAHWVAQGALVTVPLADGEIPMRRLQLLAAEGAPLGEAADAAMRAVAATLRALPRRRTARSTAADA